MMIEYHAQKREVTEDDQARAIWALANDDSHSAEARLKAHELYAKLMGFIDSGDESY